MQGSQMQRRAHTEGERLEEDLSLADTCPIFQSWALAMVAGHTKPPRLGPSNISATGMSPACITHTHSA